MNKKLLMQWDLRRLPSAVLASFFLLTIFLSADLRAQGAISVRGGNQTLSITTAMPGSEPLPVVNTNGSLRYRRQAAIAKITVRTICFPQHYALKVVAAGVSRGVAAPEVTLTNGMLDTDFITNIPAFGFNFANATLQYTASATFAQGNSLDNGGDDVHTVTYTILAQ